SSGGGGGGGGATGDTDDIGDKITYSWTNLAAGRTLTVKVGKATMAVDNVKFTTKNSIPDCNLEIARLDSKPLTAIAFSGTIYEYLRITPGGMDDDDISSAVITFKVPESWFTTHNVGSHEIRLYRYKDSLWNELQTTILNVSNSNVYYKADSPGFSYFIIGVYYEPEPSPSCYDGLQNGNETGIDCGGPCDPCSGDIPTCYDSLKNGDETGVDCGGSCPACEGDLTTCEDGLKNGDETGVDCGGSCQPCDGAAGRKRSWLGLFVIILVAAAGLGLGAYQFIQKHHIDFSFKVKKKEVQPAPPQPEIQSTEPEPEVKETVLEPVVMEPLKQPRTKKEDLLKDLHDALEDKPKPKAKLIAKPMAKPVKPSKKK
ncbi:MAG: PGF-pre-PGF domain-containing protein, partial [Nanoarchaeota archaeon]|nr:PGF-pre-PGF domain-containing protein [Nanoarchaeota archaeon]